MKKMKVAILALALSLGGASLASAQSAEQQPPRARGGEMQRGARRGGPEAMLLKGITLTAEQKTSLEALRNSDEDKSSREQFRKAMTDARDARERGDTVAANAKMRELRAQMNARRDKHIASLRALLTSDQQRQFDANVAELKQHGDHPRDGHGRA